MRSSASFSLRLSASPSLRPEQVLVPPLELRLPRLRVHGGDAGAAVLHVRVPSLRPRLEHQPAAGRAERLPSGDLVGAELAGVGDDAVLDPRQQRRLRRADRQALPRDQFLERPRQTARTWLSVSSGCGPRARARCFRPARGSSSRTWSGMVVPAKTGCPAVDVGGATERRTGPGHDLEANRLPAEGATTLARAPGAPSDFARARPSRRRRAAPPPDRVRLGEPEQQPAHRRLHRGLPRPARRPDPPEPEPGRHQDQPGRRGRAPQPTRTPGTGWSSRGTWTSSRPRSPTGRATRSVMVDTGDRYVGRGTADMKGFLALAMNRLARADVSAAPAAPGPPLHLRRGARHARRHHFARTWPHPEHAAASGRHRGADLAPRRPDAQGSPQAPAYAAGRAAPTAAIPTWAGARSSRRRGRSRPSRASAGSWNGSARRTPRGSAPFRTSPSTPASSAAVSPSTCSRLAATSTSASGSCPG